MNASATISSSEQRDIENEIISRRWDAIRRRLASDAATRSFRATYRNENGLNAFHRLCANNDAPPDVVQNMASVDEAYLWAKTPASDLVGGEATALHLAAETGSVSTIKILLDRMCNVIPWTYECEDDHRTWLDDEDLTPLDILWRSRLIPNYLMYNGEERDGNDVQSITDFIKHLNSITCYADMNTEMQDLWEKVYCFIHAALALANSSQGRALSGGKQWFLIHEIVKIGGREEMLFPSEVLWLAGKIYPDFLRMRDENGDLPLHIAFVSPQEWSGAVLEESVDAISEDKDGDDFHQLQSLFYGHRSAVGMLLQMCPEAAATKNKKGMLPLHILCDNILSPTTMQLTSEDIHDLVTSNPKAFLAPNMTGNLPLHVVLECLSECYSRFDHCIGDQSWNIFTGIPRSGTMETTMSLINSSPREALKFRDKAGRLPLHLLLDGGSPVGEKIKRDPGGGYRYSVVPDVGVVDALVEKAPDTLDLPDPKTCLFPFMMAAVGKNSAIDCIYSLLRKSPTNVKSGIVHSRYEKYLLQKMDDMKNNTDREHMYLSSKISSLEKEIADLKMSEKKRKLGS